ncbi:MAG: HAMP domain-containing histidine kinase [Actinomycetia bacterium]|nr:HAMP domain-containing histidine kinase [Actinomycetes bacterium]
MRPARRPRVRKWMPLAILAAAVAVAALLAWIGGASARDSVSLVALALGGAAAAVLVVMLVTRLRHSSGIATHTAAVALVSVSATTVGVVVGARAMFISAHDLTALGVIVATATGAGLAVAWQLGSRIDRDVTELTELSEELARGERPASTHSEVAELDRLGDDLVAMADRLAEAHQRELTLERSRRELVAWVSHDLRSPLAGIRAMAEAMEDGVVTEPEDVARYLRSIGEETSRLAQLVDDLFELSRVTSGLAGVDARAVSLADLVLAGARGAGPVAEAARVDLRLPSGVDSANLPTVCASEAETVRVLGNLLDNAIRHTPAGGVVSVEVSTTARTAAVSVIDECGGIPADDLEQVFDVAFRGDAARSRSDAGGGLGLAIAKGLAEAQEGSIAVANHEGGCCFTVEIPLATTDGATG